MYSKKENMLKVKFINLIKVKDKIQIIVKIKHINLFKNLLYIQKFNKNN